MSAPPDLSTCYLCGAPLADDAPIVLVLVAPLGTDPRVPAGKVRVPAHAACTVCADRVRLGGAPCA